MGYTFTFIYNTGTCMAESPGGTQAYSSSAQPLSSSDAADGQLRAAGTEPPPPAAVDGDLGDRCDGPRGAVGEGRSSSGGEAAVDGGLGTGPARSRSPRGRHAGILAGGSRRPGSRAQQLVIFSAASLLYTRRGTATHSITIIICNKSVH